MPGETTSALTPSHAAGRVRSASAIPSAAAFSRAAAPSSQATTSAPPAAQRRDRRQPRPPEPEHRHLVAVIAPHRDHRRANLALIIAISWCMLCACDVHGLYDPRFPAHRSFSVASPIIARISETIQNRITICGSAQPSFSK